MTEQRMVPVELLEDCIREAGYVENYGLIRRLRAIIDGPGVEPVGYIDAEQLRRWDILRGTEFESPERCLMPFSRIPFKSDMNDCSLAVFLAAPSAPVQSAPDDVTEALQSLKERIAALEAELAEAKRVTFDARILEEMNRLEAENAELRRDAERYRWLRNHNGELYGFGIQVAISRPSDPNTFWVHCDEGLDAVIDTAMKRENDNG